MDSKSAESASAYVNMWCELGLHPKYWLEDYQKKAFFNFWEGMEYLHSRDFQISIEEGRQLIGYDDTSIAETEKKEIFGILDNLAHHALLIDVSDGRLTFQTNKNVEKYKEII